MKSRLDPFVSTNQRLCPIGSAAEATDEDEASNENTEGIAEDHSGLSGDTTSTSIEPTPYSTLLAAVRYASAYNADNLEYYGWGEVVGSFRTRCLDLAAIKLKPTASPIVHLAVSSPHSQGCVSGHRIAPFFFLFFYNLKPEHAFGMLLEKAFGIFI